MFWDFKKHVDRFGCASWRFNIASGGMSPAIDKL
jgi:hypothetical protein